MSELNIGIAGLGRLGRIHAENIAFRVTGARLAAACSIIPDELVFAKNSLGVEYCTDSYTDLLKAPGLDAIAIVTTSGLHAAQIEQALDAGKHVFCEKPLGVAMDECRVAERAVEKHPDLIFQLGFMRRFDPSYAYAKKKIDEGLIGTPYLVKTCGLDPIKFVEGALKFAPTSGGLFLDMAVHDIDIARWFLGSDPVSVTAFGSSFGYPAFAEFGDCEAGVALYRHENGAMSTIHVGRTASHGYHIETEIIGTLGSLRIGGIPRKNQCEIYGADGVLTECPEHFPERFADAYRLEMQAFVDAVRENRKPNITVYDGTACTKIGYATTEAFKTGEMVKI